MPLRSVLTVTLLIGSAAPLAAQAAERAPFSLNHTSWSFVDGGTTVVETIDDNGAYVINTADGKHVDHGTVVMKGDKSCSTSAMDNSGEHCWKMPRYGVEEGQSFTAISDSGRQLKVTRLGYRGSSEHN